MVTEKAAGVSSESTRALAPAPRLNIALSAIGRFHMFDLARQLMRLGQDVRLYTGNPRNRVDADLREVTRTHPVWHTLDV